MCAMNVFLSFHVYKCAPTQRIMHICLCVALHMRQLERCMSVCTLWAAALCPER